MASFLSNLRDGNIAGVHSLTVPHYPLEYVLSNTYKMLGKSFGDFMIPGNVSRDLLLKMPKYDENIEITC